MLHQDIIQVYDNEDGDAVIAVGVFKGLDQPVEIQSIVIPYSEISEVSRALSKVAAKLFEDLE